MWRLISLIPGLALIAMLFFRFQTYEEPIRGKWPLVILVLGFASVVAAFINAERKEDKKIRSIPDTIFSVFHIIFGASGAFVIILKFMLPLLPQVGDYYR